MGGTAPRSLCLGGEREFLSGAQLFVHRQRMQQAIHSAQTYSISMLSGANAFEMSDIERMNIGASSAGRLGRNNVL